MTARTVRCARQRVRRVCRRRCRAAWVCARIRCSHVCSWLMPCRGLLAAAGSDQPRRAARLAGHTLPRPAPTPARRHRSLGEVDMSGWGKPDSAPVTEQIDLRRTAQRRGLRRAHHPAHHDGPLALPARTGGPRAGTVHPLLHRGFRYR